MVLPVTRMSIQCVYCVDGVFSRRIDYAFHLRNVHSRHMCSDVKCMLDFASNKNVKQHFASVHGGLRYMCDTCGRSYHQRGGFSKHRLDVNGVCAHAAYMLVVVDMGSSGIDPAIAGSSSGSVPVVEPMVVVDCPVVPAVAAPMGPSVSGGVGVSFAEGVGHVDVGIQTEREGICFCYFLYALFYLLLCSFLQIFPLTFVWIPRWILLV